MIKNKFEITIIIAFALFIITSCSAQRSKNIRALEYITQMPEFYEAKDGTAIPITDSLAIFYMDEYVLCRLSPTIETKHYKKIEASEPYFIYRDKNHYGFYFTSLNDSAHGKKMSVDSIYCLHYPKMSSCNIQEMGYELSEQITSKDSALLQKYVAANRLGEGYPDSVYYYFSKSLGDIPYSLSPKRDSIQKMKLVKVELLYKELLLTKLKKIIPKREASVEVRSLPIKNPKEIIALFEKFKKQIPSSSY